MKWRSTRKRLEKQRLKKRNKEQRRIAKKYEEFLSLWNKKERLCCMINPLQEKSQDMYEDFSKLRIKEGRKICRSCFAILIHLNNGIDVPRDGW